MHLTPLLSLWAALIAALLIVTFFRMSLARREDDHLHFETAEHQMVLMQTAIADKLDLLERWRTVLLVLVVISGLAIGSLYLYGAWQYTSAPHN